MTKATFCLVCAGDQLTRTAYIAPASFIADLNLKR